MRTKAQLEPSDRAKEWHAFTHDELKRRRRKLGGQRQLVAGILPQGAIGVVLGESGLGKTPLLYQLGLSVASGKDFLGHRVTQGSVLYLDYENGLFQVEKMVTGLSQHFGLGAVPDDLLLWNVHDTADDDCGSPDRAIEMIADIKPDLAIIDSLASFHPEAEEKNSLASKMLQRLRSLLRDDGTTVLLVHHLRKPSSNPQYQPPSLNGPEFRQWFQQARGASVLMNGSDVRIGLTLPATQQIYGDNEQKEVALFMRGFARISGEIPGASLARCCNEDGEPLGYELVAGSGLLDNPEQRRALDKLPDRFRFTDARQVYGRRDQATTDFLRKAQAVGILKKRGKLYVKVDEKAE